MKLLRAEKDYQMFPDEIDTPLDTPARVRFEKLVCIIIIIVQAYWGITLGSHGNRRLPLLYMKFWCDRFIHLCSWPD